MREFKARTQAAHELQMQAAQLVRSTVVDLERAGLTRREAAVVLAVSPERMSQLGYGSEHGAGADVANHRRRRP